MTKMLLGRGFAWAKEIIKSSETFNSGKCLWISIFFFFFFFLHSIVFCVDETLF